MENERLELWVPRFPRVRPERIGGFDANHEAITALHNAFEFVSADELGERQPPPWLVHGLLPVGGIAVLIGKPGDGKTFLALDLCLSVTQGIDFHGYQTRRGAAIYVAAEGATGLGQRVRAFKEARGLSSLVDAWFLEEPLHLIEMAEVLRFIRSVNQRIAVDPALIVIDTLARSMPGRDENSAMDMGLLIAEADRLRKEYAATVMLVHHLRVDGERERGSTALRGGADTMIRVSKSGDRITVSCEKQKDAPAFPPFQLYLAQAGTGAVLRDTPSEEADTSHELNSSEKTALFALSENIPMSFSIWNRESGLPKSTFKNLPNKLFGKRLVRLSGNSRWVRTAAGSERLGLSSQQSLEGVSEDLPVSGLAGTGSLEPGPRTPGVAQSEEASARLAQSYGCRECGHFRFPTTDQLCYRCRAGAP